MSTRTKEAIKTALAMTIAYAVALSMDWDRPYWAAFAVAFISLSTVGQSLNKGAMRMLGTLVAFAASLTLIALFAQERWWFMVALSALVGFCTYMNGGAKNQYFWFVVGFVTVIIAFDGGTDPVNAFDTAVLRAQETGLGILAYTLVTILVWPTSTRTELDTTVRRLLTTQHDLYVSYRQQLDGRGATQDTHDLRMQQVQQFNQFSQALAAARTDSYEVWEVRRQWSSVEAQLKELMGTLERWRESLKEVESLDLKDLLPNLDALGEELEGRFQQIAQMLEGNAPERFPRAVDLPLNKGAERTLSHFQKAALAVTRARLQRLEELTRSVFATLADISGIGASSPVLRETDPPQPGFMIDPDRITSSVRVMAGLWLAYLMWIYVEVPGGAGIVSAVVPIGISLANMPQLPVSALFKPAAASIAFAGLLYVFVMPLLSSFAGLGLMIFLATFTICYLFATPRQALGRAFGLAMFVTIAGISNQQSYSFLSVADTAAMFAVLFALLALVANIPHLARPEKAFLRLLRRFFRSCEYLMSTMRWNITMTPTRLDRWKKAFHEREVATLPQKLSSWGKAVDGKVLSGTTPEQVQGLTANLQALAYRMQELMEARENRQAELLVRELLTDVRAWRLKVQEAFQGFSMDPAGAAPADALRERLTQRLGLLERRIEETLDKAAEGELSDRDSEYLYRLLGAYRGLSEAGIEYAGSAERIEWSRWRESRF